MGNVVGSNIFNVLLILGLSAAITPLVVSQQLIRLDVPLMVAVSLLTWFFARNGAIDRWEGGPVCVVDWLHRLFDCDELKAKAKPCSKNTKRRSACRGRSRERLIDLLLIAAGLAGLALGSLAGEQRDALRRGAGGKRVDRGPTIVAAGTSLPEVATSVMASIKGERDIAIGNVVGSNLFNLMAVLGLASAISPVGITVPPAALRVDIIVMVAVAVCLPVFFTGNRLSQLGRVPVPGMRRTRPT
ncbi:MAG: hypothetical protein R2873_24835 [Caldilineaceae bacterium]